MKDDKATERKKEFQIMQGDKATEREKEEYYLWKTSQSDPDNVFVVIGCVLLAIFCLAGGVKGIPFAIGVLVYCVYKIGDNDLKIKNDPHCQWRKERIEEIWRERAKGNEAGAVFPAGRTFTPAEWEEYKEEERRNHELWERKKERMKKVREDKQKRIEELKRQYPECYK